MKMVVIALSLVLSQSAMAQVCSAVFKSKGPRLQSTVLEPLAKTAQGMSLKSEVFVSSEAGFLKKLEMIESAKPGSKIRLGYFIFENDFSSSLLVKRLIKKAQAGVKVEILVDYMMTESYSSWLQFMASQKNITVHRFRPPSADFIQLLTVEMQIKEPQALLQGLASQNTKLIQQAIQSSPVLSAKMVEIMAELSKLKTQGQAISGEVAQVAGMMALQKVIQGINPQWGRRFLAGLNLITRRMHHKIFMVETSLGLESLVGGRNVSDEYHLSQGHALLKGRNYPFFDNEISFVNIGRAKDAMEQSYQALFASPFSVKVENTLNISQLKEQETQMLEKAQVLEAQMNDLVASTAGGKFPVKANSEMIYSENLPKGIVDHLTITENWSQLIGQAKKKVTIISAYFYLFPALRAAVKQAVARGLQVDIYTNSYSSTDLNMVNVAVYQEFAVWKQELGPHFRVFELDKQKGEGSLHAKMIAIDETVVGIGSANADPRNNGLDSNNMMFLSTAGQAGLHSRIVESYTSETGFHGLKWVELTPEKANQIFQEKVKEDPKLLYIFKIPGIRNQI